MWTEDDIGEEHRLRENIGVLNETAKVFGCASSVGKEIDAIVLRMCKRLELLAGTNEVKGDSCD